MKTHALLLLVFFLNINLSFGQLTLSHVYATEPPVHGYVKLGLSGLKYVHLHTDPAGYYTYFKLYNADHTLFKTITIPPFTAKNCTNISYISETLFDMDALVEYAITYTSNSGETAIRICNETGNVLLERDTASLDAQQLFWGINSAVFPDGNNSKLVVSKGTFFSGTFNFSAEIYDLPGQLTCLECNGGLVSGLSQPSNGLPSANKSIAYPNPFRNHVTITYNLPSSVSQAYVYLFGISGNLIKKKEIDAHLQETVVTSDEIKQGAYIYHIVADDKIIAKDKIIKL